MKDIRIDEALWSSAPHLRRLEWRTLIADLLDAEEVAPRARLMHIKMDADDVVITLELEVEDAEARRQERLIPGSILRAHFEEYLQIVRAMIEPDVPAMRLEALDMAKKVVHDRAARALAEHAPELAADHEGYRRLYSLIVALKVDTTNLPAAHRHALR